jgi:hypothetical protein
VGDRRQASAQSLGKVVKVEWVAVQVFSGSQIFHTDNFSLDGPEAAFGRHQLKPAHKKVCPAPAFEARVATIRNEPEEEIDEGSIS